MPGGITRHVQNVSARLGPNSLRRKDKNGDGAWSEEQRQMIHQHLEPALIETHDMAG